MAAVVTKETKITDAAAAGCPVRRVLVTDRKEAAIRICKGYPNE